MSLQFANPVCGHMETDDAPCNCRQATPVISTNLTVDEAMWAKWQAGRQKYGEEFVGDPIQELYAEYIDALNYFNEIERRGLLTADLVYARLSTRRLAELVRTEARR